MSLAKKNEKNNIVSILTLFYSFQFSLLKKKEKESIHTIKHTYSNFTSTKQLLLQMKQIKLERVKSVRTCVCVLVFADRNGIR